MQGANSAAAQFISAVNWYGVRTRSNYERAVAGALETKGYEPYLPLTRTRRRWSDRVVEKDLPLLPGYVFCRFGGKSWLEVLKTRGVLSVVGIGNHPAPIPDKEIDAVRMVAQSGVGTEPCAFCSEGQRVRISSGPLEGLEGIVLRNRNEWRMVVSVTLLQRSISTEVDRDSLALIESGANEMHSKVCKAFTLQAN